MSTRKPNLPSNVKHYDSDNSPTALSGFDAVALAAGNRIPGSKKRSMQEKISDGRKALAAGVAVVAATAGIAAVHNANASTERTTPESPTPAQVFSGYETDTARHMEEIRRSKIQDQATIDAERFADQAANQKK